MSFCNFVARIPVSLLPFGPVEENFTYSPLGENVILLYILGWTKGVTLVPKMQKKADKKPVGMV